MNRETQFLEAIIRRLVIKGYRKFYLKGFEDKVKDPNILFWFEDASSRPNTEYVDLLVEDFEGRTKSYFVKPETRTIDDLQKAIDVAREKGMEGLSVIVPHTSTTIPNEIPLNDLNEVLRMLGVSVEGMNVGNIAERIDDFLEIEKENIFNSSNTPVASGIIAESLGYPIEEIDRAGGALARDHLLEEYELGERLFFRKTGD